MLLDILNNSSVLQDIIKSITKPMPQLVIVLFTFAITIFIYAQWGAFALLGQDLAPPPAAL